MHEATTQAHIRRGIDKAHIERAAAFRHLIALLNPFRGMQTQKDPRPEGRGSDLQGCAA